MLNDGAYPMTGFSARRLVLLLAASLAVAGASLAATAPTKAPAPAAAPAKARSVDYIVAVVNQELVTQREVEQATARLKEEAAQAGRTVDDASARRQALDGLITERVLVGQARDMGVRVDEAELSRAVAGVASANKLTLEQLRERIQKDGMDWSRFVASVRDQLMVERLREHEMRSRIKVSEADVDAFLASQQVRTSNEEDLNLAQILIPVPEGASEAEVAESQREAQAALARVQGGEPFAEVAKQVSKDANAAQGGEIGAKPASRLPDLFVSAVRNVAVGGVTPEPVRSGAGFHVLKVISRSAQASTVSTQTHARHILLRPSAELSVDAAVKRMTDWRQQILAGKVKFEDLARKHSADEGSGAQGGDLGWIGPGQLVPEFETAMNALANDTVSQPVVSRFGVHLIQVLGRRDVPVDVKQLREQARNVLRQRQYAKAYDEWVTELRQQAYVEMREPPAS